MRKIQPHYFDAENRNFLMDTEKNCVLDNMYPTLLLLPSTKVDIREY